MRQDLIAKKKKILKRISVREYRELLAFVEKIYLSDYSLKILMARKCSNLFYALIELACEEDGGRVRRLYEKKFAEDKSPVIISDRALCYYAQSIKDREYNTILVVDDVIVHGRTVFRLYEKINNLTDGYNDDVAIDVWAYASNNDGVLQKPCIQNAVIEKKGGLYEWRDIIDMIIDTFYLAGQPYTSYVPNIVVKSGTELYKMVISFINRADMYLLNDNDQMQSNLNLQSYAWVESDTWKFSLFQSIRFYVNEDIGQCAVVPMASLMPVCGEVLLKYTEILKDFIIADYYDKIIFMDKEMNYRTVIYVISSIWGIFFFQKYLNLTTDMTAIIGNPLEEKLNFGTHILNRERLIHLNIDEIKDIFELLDREYCEIDRAALLTLSPDFAMLENEAAKLTTTGATTGAGAFVQSFLCVNGDLDEKEWKNYEKEKEEIPRRLDGYPFYLLSGQLENKYEKREIYSQILKQIDYGSGSIVTKMYEQGGISYFVSLLHAGERNYKYKEKMYFPFLYGLFEIEKAAAEKGANAVQYKSAYKKRFMEQSQTSDIGKAAGYAEDTLQELCETNITKEFKSVLIRDAWYYPKQEDLEVSINLADQIIATGIV